MSSCFRKKRISGWNLYMSQHLKIMNTSVANKWRSLGQDGQKEWNDRAGKLVPQISGWNLYMREMKDCQSLGDKWKSLGQEGQKEWKDKVKD